MDPASIATLIVALIASSSAYASQRSAAKAARLNNQTDNRTDMEKEAYSRARAFDTTTITYQQDRIAELIKEVKTLRSENDTLIAKIALLEKPRSE